MSMINNPFSVLYDEAGRAMSVSASQTLNNFNSGYVMFGSSSSGATMFRTTPAGELFITGSLETVASGVQSVTGSVLVNNLALTGSNGGMLVNQGLSSSFANAWKVVLTDGNTTAFGTQASPLWTTGSVTVNGIVSITGSVFTRELSFALSTVSRVAASITSVTLLNPNGGRRTAVLFNEGAAKAWIKLGATASTTSYTVQLGAGGSFITPEGYTGEISAIFQTTTGSIQISELA